jgi:3-oxoacyl-[acyl-carrier protein] reductase
MSRQKTALVTGGARGIGLAISETLARDGYHVLVNYFRSEEEAKDLLERLRETGCAATLLRADVANPRDVREMVAAALLETGRIDVLVNNAGLASWGLLTETPEETWDRVLATNLKSGYLLSHAVLPNMIQNKAGSIVNVSSMWGVLGASCEAAYAASKAGLIGLTRSLAQEVAPAGIRVNAVSPGVIQTDMIRGFKEEELSALIDRTPLHRIGTAQEVAEAVAFLVSDKASFITGQVLGVDGGFTCQ